MSDKQQGFWSSIPGMLTGVAAVITAATGLIIALNLGNTEIQKSVIEKESTEKPTKAHAQDGTAKPISVLADPTADSAVITLDALLDCKLFPPVNTIASLMGWSNHYHKLIIDNGASEDACNKAIAYRAEAHCKDKNDLAVRQGLGETLTLCKTINFGWKDIQR